MAVLLLYPEPGLRATSIIVLHAFRRATTNVHVLYPYLKLTRFNNSAIIKCFDLIGKELGMTEPFEGSPPNEVARSPGAIPRKRDRNRLPHNEREKMIVAEAIRFFAEVGFEGQTRVLAERLGVTQPLLYRYFPDKNALIERVCLEIFEMWHADWTELLTDRSRRLEDRVTGLYRAYVRTSYSHERARLFLFATLRDPVLAARHLSHLRTTLFVPLCREARREWNGGGGDVVPPRDIDLAASLHGAVGYAVLCRTTLPDSNWDDIDSAIATLVTTFVGAIRAGRPDAAR